MSVSADTSETLRRSGQLLRILGVGFGIAVGVGTTIGGGILRTPGEVAGYLGTAQLTFAVWLAGGLYALLCSNAVTELAIMLPRAGGWYVYSQRAFGKRVGFVVGCCDWMMMSVSNAFLSVALGELAAEQFPGLSEHVTSVAIAGMSALALLNLIGLRTGSRTQTITSLVKALALIALVIGCFTVSSNALSAPTAAHPPTHHSGLLLGWLLASQAVLLTYDGYYAPMYFAEEDQNPARNLPRSMIGTVLSCIAIFLLVNAALIQSMGMERLQLSRMPAADASLLVFGSYGRQIILVISAITLISTINANILTAPRVLFGMARDRLLPRSLTAINQGGTPVWALVLCLLVSVALIFSGTIETLIAISSILMVAVYVSGFVSLLVLRRREPHLPRPYRAWWYPWSTVCVLVVSAAFLFGAVIGDLRHALFTVILVALSYLASHLIVRRSVEAAAPVGQSAPPRTS